MPANCKEIFKVVVMIATFDMLPIDGIMEMLDLSDYTDTFEKPLPENFSEFGYETSDPIQNLEMVFIAIVGLLILPILIKLFEVICSSSYKALLVIENFKRTKVYWNVYLRFMLESYLELAIASVLRF